VPPLLPTSLVVLVSYFREVLPPRFYALLLTLFAVAIVVSLLRLLAADQVTALWSRIQWARNKKRALNAVGTWATNWTQMCQLLRTCISRDGTPPSADEELQFQTLHAWFVSHRAHFLPMYNRFLRNRFRPAHESWGDHTDVRFVMFHEHGEDPFSLVYEASDLRHAVDALGLLEARSLDRWLSRYTQRDRALAALKISEDRLVELLDYVGGPRPC